MHYVIGYLVGRDWEDSHIRRPHLACSPWEEDLPHTDVPEDVTCEKCLECMSVETEKALGVIVVDTRSWLRDAF